MVRFRSGPSDIEWRESGMLGPPPDTGWFCKRHADLAIELAVEFTRPEALARLTNAVTTPRQWTDANAPRVNAEHGATKPDGA